MKTELTDSGSKSYGIGEAQVISVRTNKQHFVKVFHPDFGVTEFIPFIQTPGMYRVPRVGDRCFVFCNENWTDYPMAWGHKLSVDNIAKLVGRRVDNITVIYSSGENNDTITHKIELDDGDDKGIRISTGSGNNVTLKDQDEIEVKHRSGSFIRVEQNSIELSVQGSTITMNSNGIVLRSANGAEVDLGAGVDIESNQGSSVKVQGDVQTESSQGSKITVDSGIEGEAADANSKFDNVSVPRHRHNGNLGYPTAPPIPEG